MSSFDKKYEIESDFPDEESSEEARLRRQWERQQEIKNAQREKRLREQRNRIRAIAVLTGICVAILIVVTILIVKVVIPTTRYNRAIDLMESGDYTESMRIFRTMAGYRDADDYLKECIKRQAVALVGSEDVHYETSESAPWFSIDDDGDLRFDSRDYPTLTEIRIPDVFNGELVTGIDDTAFFYCDNITKIEISFCVERIGERAFIGCEGLTEVVLPDKLLSIGDKAFLKCKNLERITFGNSLVSIGQEAFSECISLKEIVLPDSLKVLGARVFSQCIALESVSLGASVEKIANKVFAICEKLTTFVFRGTEAEWNAIVPNPSAVGLENVTPIFKP